MTQTAIIVLGDWRHTVTPARHETKVWQFVGFDGIAGGSGRETAARQAQLAVGTQYRTSIDCDTEQTPLIGVYFGQLKLPPKNGLPCGFSRQLLLSRRLLSID